MAGKVKFWLVLMSSGNLLWKDDFSENNF